MISFFIAAGEISGRSDRIAKRAIETGGIFGGISKDEGIMKSIAFKLSTNRADAPVHHVRWSDDIYSCFGMRSCLLDEHLDSLIIQHIAILIDDAVLPVCRIRIECDIAYHGKVGMLRFDGCNGTLHEPDRVCGFFTIDAL